MEDFGLPSTNSSGRTEFALSINTQSSFPSSPLQMDKCPQIPPTILCTLVETIAGVGLIVGSIVSFANYVPDAMLGTGVAGSVLGACFICHGFCDEAGADEKLRSCIIPWKFILGSAVLGTGVISTIAWGILYDGWAS